VALREAFRSSGYRADYEVEVLSLHGDRRPDVFVATPDERLTWAIEIQHSPILYPDIQARTQAYIAAQVPVMWLGLLSAKMRADGEATAYGFRIHQYAIRPWEKWAHALAFSELWYVDPSEGTLWRGKFLDLEVYVEPTTWYESGVKQSAGGYRKKSRRWKTLELMGPFHVAQLRLGTKWRSYWSSPVFSLPQGRIATLSVIND
jgi:competence protein CoiA